jgi:hypothetical protein
MKRRREGKSWLLAQQRQQPYFNTYRYADSNPYSHAEANTDAEAASDAGASPAENSDW